MRLSYTTIEQLALSGDKNACEMLATWVDLSLKILGSEDKVRCYWTGTNYTIGVKQGHPINMIAPIGIN